MGADGTGVGGRPRRFFNDDKEAAVVVMLLVVLKEVEGIRSGCSWFLLMWFFFLVLFRTVFLFLFLW